MKTEESKLEAQQEQLDIPVVINACSEELLEFIEEMVSNAYEVGYHHGWNISRTVPKREDEGWGQYFTKIKERLLKHCL